MRVVVLCIWLFIQQGWWALAFVSHENIHHSLKWCHNTVGRSSMMFSSTRLLDAPEPLAEEGSWQAFLDDETTGLIYYFDTKTGESLWEPPTSTFPDIRLSRKKQRIAEELRRNYRKGRQQQSELGEGGTSSSSSSSSSVQVVEKTADDGAGSGLPSWIEGLVEKGEVKASAETTPAPATEKVEESVKEEKEGWFSGLFGDKGVGSKQEEEFSNITENEMTNGETVVLPKEKTGFFAALATDTVQEETGKEEKDGWFSGLFGDKGAVPSNNTKLEEVPTKKGAKKQVPNGEPVVLKEKPGLFAALGGLKEKAASAVIETETTGGKTPEPAVKKQAEKRQAQEPSVVTSPKPIKIEMGSHILPHPGKIRWGGEDAIFTKGRTFGVFDGVSGAEKRDGVPLYSRTLANEMKKSIGLESVSVQELTKLLTDAADFADESATGASTAVVASIGENGFLQALNLGDSLCLVVRDGKIAAKTREISHYWECPYQLSDDCPDRPRDGTKLNVELITGDIVVMGSDGIFDNVSEDMLLDVIAKSGRLNPTQLSKKICDISRKQSLDEKSETPYAKQAQRRGDQDFKDGLGGKLDDASCIVVVCK